MKKNDLSTLTDEELLKKYKTGKTTLKAFAFIWGAVYITMIGLIIYGNIDFKKISPFIILPITLLPIFISCNNLKKEVEERGLSNK